ncbi:SDR family oxidoreductase [Pseudonocardia sp. CA-107938]|uniref:SDR family oxidoreductase n=1 Tax=Pseudonocardia sp. CA-107938 TaxID=3240021 RepID=UPI003D91EB54
MSPRPLALVTGATRGIGAAIARALAPTHSLLLGGRDAGQLAAVADALPDAVSWPFDLLDLEAVTAAASRIEHLDVLVHSAGVAELGTVADADPAAWRRNFELNLLAPVALTRALLPALRAAGGHVVVINSGQGISAREGWGPYAASKFGARAFADVLRAEEPRLRVTSIFPGRTDTEMQQAIVAAEGGTYRPAEYLRPDSIAAAVASAVGASPDAHQTEIVIRPR